MSNIDIIIFGQMGSGKSTVADYLVKNYNFLKIGLGDKIHSECKLHGSETRQQMQDYGQMMRKIFGQDVWCNYTYQRYLDSYDLPFVIEDGRQINEFNYFLLKGFLPIGIRTDDTLRLERLQKRVEYKVNAETLQHETEIQALECVNKCDICLVNNYGVEELYQQIEEKLGGYLLGKV